MLKILPYPAAARDIELVFVGQRWTPEWDARLLTHLVRQVPGDILEIGCNNGTTTFELASQFPGRQVIGVDWLPAVETMVAEQRYESPRADFGRHAEDMPNVTLRHQDSKSLDYTKLGEVGVVFIDGDHSYPGVEMDTILAVEHLHKRGGQGMIVWHDYNSTHPDWIAVKTFVDKLAERYEIEVYEDSWLAVLRFPAVPTI